MDDFGSAMPPSRGIPLSDPSFTIPETNRHLRAMLDEQRTSGTVASRALFWARIAGVTGVIGVLIGVAALIVALMR